MIAAFACILFPFMSNCGAFVQDAPAIAQVLQRKDAFDAKEVTVTGRVSRLDQWNSPGDAPEQLFSVCDGGCIRVFMRARSAIQNGQLVTVTGKYHAQYRVGRRTYYNEIEGTQVLPRE